MRIGSLFAGIGGLERGLEVAGLGETVWQVELDPYCRAVLAKHWPTAERFEDVKTAGKSTLVPVDVICGGFPCQDVSSAGKRVGLDGARSGLWFEYLRIVSELRPSWVVVENVASGAAKWVDAVCEGLGEQGYACLPVPIAAADVGAPHERARIFIVATLADSESARVRVEQGGPSRTGGQGAAKSACDGASRGVAANTNAHAEHVESIDAEVALAPADPNVDAFKRVAGRWSHGRRRTKPSDGHWQQAMPDVVRVADGIPKRMDSPRRRIAALGNSVVPQCAEVIGHVILELMR